MSDLFYKRIRLVYGILLSVAILITGWCLICACVGIYRSGDAPFSREAVGAAFQGISLMVYICLGLIVGGFAVAALIPQVRKKGQQPPIFMQLHRISEKTDLDNSGPSLRQAVKKLRMQRTFGTWTVFGALVIGSSVFLYYALDGSHFDLQDINGSIVTATLLLLCCMALPFVLAVLTRYYANASMRKELALLKEYGTARTGAETKKEPFTALQITRWTLLVVALGFVGYGLLNNGTLDVLTKAINICTECVGLG